MEYTSGGSSAVRERRESRERSAARNGESKSPEKKKSDAFFRLTVVQCLIVAAALAALIAVGRLSASSFAQLKAVYEEKTKTDMTAGELVSAVRDYAAYVFAPMSEKEAEKSGDSLEKTGRKTGESVATGEISPSGGEDIGEGDAAKGTSLALYEVSEEAFMPVNSTRITSGFGWRDNPISGNYGFHTGIDLSSPEGAPISSVFFGQVEETGEDDKWGKYILVRHSDSLKTYYCHCSEVLVNEGDIIRKGETVGLVGTTGWSTGPHLHFEVRIDGIRVDPALLLFGERST